LFIYQRKYLTNGIAIINKDIMGLNIILFELLHKNELQQLMYNKSSVSFGIILLIASWQSDVLVEHTF
jgi:uncharacterized membrane protein